MKHAMLLAVAGVAGLACSAHAAILDELPGNEFKSTAAANAVYVSNPQDMTWGSGVTGPSGGDSPVTDGDISTHWDSGRSTYMNVGFTAGHFNSGTFVQNTFGEIKLIRIWAADNRYPNDDGTYYVISPPRLRISYTTAALPNPSDAYTYNGDMHGSNTNYPNYVTISSLNGISITPTTDYVTLGQTAFTNGGSSGVSVDGYTMRYVDVGVNIPAGATSVALQFGDIYNPIKTNETQGMVIADVQAAVPEPGSLGVLGIGAMGLMVRRRGKPTTM